MNSLKLSNVEHNYPSNCLSDWLNGSQNDLWAVYRYSSYSKTIIIMETEGVMQSPESTAIVLNYYTYQSSL